MSARVCSRCGAPITHGGAGEIVTCRFCGAEQDLEPAPPPAPLASAALPVPRWTPPYPPSGLAARDEPIGDDPSPVPRKSKLGLALLGLVIAGAVGLGVASVVHDVSTRNALEERDRARASAEAARAATPPPPPSPPVVDAGLDPDAIPTTVTLALSRTGGDPGALVDPRYVAVDAKGFVYVAEKTGRIQRFDGEGNLVSALRAETTNGPHGPLSTDIATPQGLAADRRGRVWVSFGYDLLAFDVASGKQVARVPHRFPATCFRNVTIDPTGAMLVRSACTDKDVYAYVRMDGDGHALATFPQSPAWETDAEDKAAVDAAGNVYQPHGHESEVVVVDGHFRPVSRFGGQGDTLGHFRMGAPGAIAIDAGGRLLVVNGEDVDVYDLQAHPQGRLQRRWEGTLRDIAVAPDGQIWVVDHAGVVRVKTGA